MGPTCSALFMVRVRFRVILYCDVTFICVNLYGEKINEDASQAQLGLGPENLYIGPFFMQLTNIVSKSACSTGSMSKIKIFSEKLRFAYTKEIEDSLRSCKKIIVM